MQKHSRGLFAFIDSALFAYKARFPNPIILNCFSIVCIIVQLFLNYSIDS